MIKKKSSQIQDTLRQKFMFILKTKKICVLKIVIYIRYTLQDWNRVSITDLDCNPGQTQMWPSLIKVEAFTEAYVHFGHD